MPVTHYGIIYDPETLAPRRVISPTDAKALFDGTHFSEPNAVYCVVTREQVAHLLPDLGEMAREAIRIHTNRSLEPPTMEEVYETDRAARGENS